MENFCGFHGLASYCKSFPVNFHKGSQKVAIAQTTLSQEFPTNFNKMLQPQKFFTRNDLHYTVLGKLYLCTLHIGGLSSLLCCLEVYLIVI